MGKTNVRQFGSCWVTVFERAPEGCKLGWVVWVLLGGCFLGFSGGLLWVSFGFALCKLWLFLLYF
jgi:hypothetical protein